MRLLLFTIFAVAMTLTAQAQLDASLNLTGIYASKPQVHVEYGVSEKFGIEASFGTALGKDELSVTSGGVTTTNEWKRGGFLAGAQAKYYFSPDENTTGFYGALYMRYRNTTWDDLEVNGTAVQDPIKYTNNRLALGLAIGAKYLIADKFVVEAAGGAGFAPVSDNEFATAFDGDLGFFDKVDNIDLYARISVGYRIF